MTTLYHTLFVESLEHNNMTAAPVIKGNTSGFLPTGASLSISKWRLREIGVLELTYCAAAILDGSPMRPPPPPSFISIEEGVSPTTIITPRIFTGFSHGLVCYKRQRFSYDTGRCHTRGVATGVPGCAGATHSGSWHT